MIICINAADCGVPQLDGNVTLNYTSTVEGSILTLTCEDDTYTDGQILRLNATCHSSGNWIPDPTQFTCSGIVNIDPLKYCSLGSKHASNHLQHLYIKIN